MWENIEKNVDITQDAYFAMWAFLERRWAGYGGPGMSVHTHPVRAAALLGHNEDVLMDTILYRAEDGELLCSYTTYMLDGQPKPFWMYVHPDHLREGIGTKVMKYALERFGDNYDFSKGAENTNRTEAMANFTNKFVNAYITEQNQGE